MDFHPPAIIGIIIQIQSQPKELTYEEVIVQVNRILENIIGGMSIIQEHIGTDEM